MKAGAVLGLCVGVALAGVVGVHEITRDAIEEAERDAVRAQLAAVLPEGHDNDPVGEARRVPNPVQEARGGSRADARGGAGNAVVYPARRGDQLLGVAVRAATPEGYGGRIELLVGVDADGRVTAVRVLDHRETPGLGDGIEAARSDWSEQFSGRSLGDPPPEGWTVAPDGGAFDALTGATISARAVVEAVRDVLAEWARRDPGSGAEQGAPVEGEP